MPKVRPGEHTGCEVSGRILDASGQGVNVRSLTVRAARCALVNDILYPPADIVVPIGADGRWRVRLLPSSAAGEYVVRIDQQRFKMLVPDATRAEFAAIARAPGE